MEKDWEAPEIGVPKCSSMKSNHRLNSTMHDILQIKEKFNVDLQNLYEQQLVAKDFNFTYVNNNQDYIENLIKANKKQILDYLLEDLTILEIAQKVIMESLLKDLIDRKLKYDVYIVIEKVIFRMIDLEPKNWIIPIIDYDIIDFLMDFDYEKWSYNYINLFKRYPDMMSDLSEDSAELLYFYIELDDLIKIFLI